MCHQLSGLKVFRYLARTCVFRCDCPFRKADASLCLTGSVVSRRHLQKKNLYETYKERLPAPVDTIRKAYDGYSSTEIVFYEKFLQLLAPIEWCIMISRASPSRLSRICFRKREMRRRIIRLHLKIQVTSKAGLQFY